MAFQSSAPSGEETISATNSFKCHQGGREVEEALNDRERLDGYQAAWVASEPLPVCSRPGLAKHMCFETMDEPCLDGRSG